MSLGQRIKQAAEITGGLNQLADAIETPRRTLGDWVSGATEPKATAIVRIAEASGVSLIWLVLGKGPKLPAKVSPSVDAGLMERLAHIVEAAYRQAHQKIPPTRLVYDTVELYSRLYERLTDITDRDEVEATLPQLAYLMRKRLAEAEPGSGKASASE